jgi:LemA protein
MPGPITAILIAAALGLLWVGWTYNRLVKSRNQMREGWSGIDVQLKRRHELVPALVACVRGYQSHEQKVLESVTEKRRFAEEASGPADSGKAETVLGDELLQLVALAEDYPDLKSDQTFLKLMKDLVGVENQIQFARRYYNGSVRDLNNLLQSFPSNLVASTFSFEEGEFFEVKNAGDRLPPDLAGSIPG